MSVMDNSIECKFVNGQPDQPHHRTAALFFSLSRLAQYNACAVVALCVVLFGLGFCSAPHLVPALATLLFMHKSSSPIILSLKVKK